MPSVLFVCSANRFRSPLAAAFFSRLLESSKSQLDWSVSSAGTWAEPGLPPDGRAVQDARSWGLDISPHRSRQVNARILSQSNLILVMEAGQKEALQIEFPLQREKIYMLSEVVEDIAYDVPDPFSSEDVTHQEISKELLDLVKRGFNNICNLALAVNK